MKSTVPKEVGEERQAPYLVRSTPREAAEEQEGHFGKGALAGLIGGLIGTIVMTQFQNAWSKASGIRQNSNSTQEGQGEQKQQG